VIRDIVLPKLECRAEAVSVPEWGVTVSVRELPYRDLIAALDLAREHGDSIMYVLARCVYDADGNRAFGDEDAAKLDAANNESRVVLMRLWAVAKRLNGLDAETGKA
jgi:hypothetical protein